MNNLISVIIPNYNSVATIDRCLRAVLATNYPNLEIIVVDDASSDASVQHIKRYPVQLLRLPQHGGASMARNTGAAHSRGDILFFTDADCVLLPDTLRKASEAIARADTHAVIGGTYTRQPADKRFFSQFQSIFVHYSETKNACNPDYIATHAMVVDSKTFQKSGGFSENFLPILEDVEFSHRLRRGGYHLHVDSEILVRHIFNFSLFRSLRNALRKSMYWTIYSIDNRDLLSDSGTASVELKVNVCSWFMCLILITLLQTSVLLLPAISLLYAANLTINRRLLMVFYKVHGPVFFLCATLYYLALYPLAVGIGTLIGVLGYPFRMRQLKESV